jgi:hypothetical protein
VKSLTPFAVKLLTPFAVKSFVLLAVKEARRDGKGARRARGGSKEKAGERKIFLGQIFERAA